MTEKQKFYTLRDVADMLGIQVRTVREWLRKGKLKAIKYENCRMWFVPQSEIDRITKSDETKDKE